MVFSLKVEKFVVFMVIFTVVFTSSAFFFVKVAFFVILERFELFNIVDSYSTSGMSSQIINVLFSLLFVDHKTRHSRVQ